MKLQIVDLASLSNYMQIQKDTYILKRRRIEQRCRLQFSIFHQRFQQLKDNWDFKTPQHLKPPKVLESLILECEKLGAETWSKPLRRFKHVEDTLFIDLRYFIEKFKLYGNEKIISIKLTSLRKLENVISTFQLAVYYLKLIYFWIFSTKH